MYEITIVTNHVPRFIVEAYELTEKERAQFEYLDWQAIENGEDSASFFRYRGDIYDIGDFEAVRDSMHDFQDWHGYQSDSFFSGIVIRYSEDMESVIVGRFFT